MRSRPSGSCGLLLRLPLLNLSFLLRPHVGLEDVGDAVAQAVHRDAAPIAHLVPEGLHLLYALDLADHLIQRGPTAQVEGDEPAGQLGYPVLEA